MQREGHVKEPSEVNVCLRYLGAIFPRWFLFLRGKKTKENKNVFYLDIPNYCRTEYDSWSLFFCIKTLFREKANVLSLRQGSMGRLKNTLLHTKPHFSLFGFQDHRPLRGSALWNLFAQIISWVMDCFNIQ